MTNAVRASHALSFLAQLQGKASVSQCTRLHLVRLVRLVRSTKVNATEARGETKPQMLKGKRKQIRSIIGQSPLSRGDAWERQGGERRAEGQVRETVAPTTIRGDGSGRRHARPWSTEGDRANSRRSWPPQSH